MGSCKTHEDSKAKCKILPLGWDVPKHKYKQANEWVESRGLEGLVAKKLYLGWQYVLAAQKANSILSSFKRSMASRSREIIFPLYYLHMMPPGILDSALRSVTKEGYELVGTSPEESH